MGRQRADHSREREERLFQYLLKCIDRPCPTNRELCELLGVSNPTLNNTLYRLVDRKQIKIVFLAIHQRKILIPGAGETLPTKIKATKSAKAAKKRDELLTVLESFKGFPCPTTKHIAEITGSDYGTTNYRIQRLAREGKLKIERINKRRRKFIFSDGAETEPTKIYYHATGVYV